MPRTPSKRTRSAAVAPTSATSSPPPSPARVKPEDGFKTTSTIPSKPSKPPAALSAAAQKKVNLYTAQLKAGSPFPQHQHPTPEEAQEVCDLLASVHGLPVRPGKLEDREDAPAGCGQVPSVLDALVRTILSQNTTSKNSTAAKRQMDVVYGRAAYRAVLSGGADKLEDAIRCGGLAKNKAKAILGVLRKCEERNVEMGGKEGEGELSLDWLHELTDEDAMKQLISFDLVGIKTASCVLLFCLGRDSFAVDTHVWRITQSLGWLPSNGSVYTAVKPEYADSKPDVKPSPSSPSSPFKATYTRLTTTSQPPSRDQTFYHLDAVLPSHLKYPLHSLLVRHGRGCVKCSANGVTSQDFVDTCPIEGLVKGGKRGKGRGARGKKRAAGQEEEEGEDEEHEVPVKDEDGRVVGTASAAAGAKGDKAAFHPLDDAPVELGKTAHDAVKLEDEVGGAGGASPASSRARRSTRSKRVKYEDAGSSAEDDESSAAEEDADEEEDDFKPPMKRARKTAPQLASLKKALPASKRSASGGRGGKAKKVKAEDGSSVDRDEAEMSGRGWKEAPRVEMHGLEV
ncbi:hypothetical protein JCM8097_004564 [Rhodosporidiobolus ruineniae]